jgi:hypothetical protein
MQIPNVNQIAVPSAPPASPALNSPRISARDLAGAFQQRHHVRVFDDGLFRLTGHGLQHGGDQFRIRRQRQEFLRAGADGAHRGFSIIGPPASNDRAGNAFFGQAGNQPANIMRYIAENQIGSIGAQFRKPSRRPLSDREAGAARHCYAGLLAKFSFQGTNNQDTRHITRRDLISRFLSW